MRLGRGRPIGGETAGIEREGEPATAVLVFDSRKMGGLCSYIPPYWRPIAAGVFLAEIRCQG